MLVEEMGKGRGKRNGKESEIKGKKKRREKYWKVNKEGKGQI